MTGVERMSGIDRLGAFGSNRRSRPMRYGMNPHQPASIVAGHGPRVINGEPSMINYLDALNAFELVREADDATGAPAAASFKHVSPAGAALAGPVDATAARVWRVDETSDGGLLSAYVRARDADPKSSFGDVVALSRPVDLATAEFLRTVICDAVIAPGFEPGTAEVLAAKRDGRFLVLEADPGRTPPAVERRDVLGVTIEQERDAVPVATVLPDDGALDPATRADALLGLVTLRYTQSNSVALVRGGAAIGIGAGQQNRVDCVRLAAAKARTWWLRRHPFVDGLPAVDGMGRQDRLNWQIRFAGQEMTAGQLTEFQALFGAAARARYDATWRDEWLAALTSVTLASDGFLPFRDNVEYAAAAGVTTIVEPGGSARTDEVAASAAAHGIAHVQTGLRLFHH
jgi:phosphoribosylaminoimidazolecarboxamide formyltransferase / IMP cyclohydrolase